MVTKYEKKWLKLEVKASQCLSRQDAQKILKKAQKIERKLLAHGRVSDRVVHNHEQESAQGVPQLPCRFY